MLYWNHRLGRKVSAMGHVLSCSPFDSVPAPRGRSRPQEQRRNPYDGLRPWSAITHGIGAVLAVFATILLLVRTVAVGGDVWKLVSFSIYGVSMTALYTASTLYHCVNTSVRGRVALRKYDHTAIYFLIAGTYTPVCLTALRGLWGWSLLGVIWALTIAGLVMSLVWINCPRKLTATVYISMGWLAVIAIYPLVITLGLRGIVWLLAGGVLYTVGGVLSALKWPGRHTPRFGCHEVFHVFILLGSIAHFMMVYQVLLPL